MTPFPITADQPARFTAPLPAACDVVVLGGGVIGVMTAWHLAERGLRVVLCEKGRIAAEQSSRNWGWIRQQGRDPGELPLMVESLAIWKSLAAEFGAGLGFRQDGVLYLARSDRELTGFQNWLAAAAGHGLDSQMISQRRVQTMLQGSAGPWLGGLFTPSDARAEPWYAVPMLAEGADKRGVVIVEGCAVRRLDRAGGKVAGVITEKGRIACDHVVVAGGAWSALFLRAEGISIPQLSVLSSVGATTALPPVFMGNAADDRFAFRRRLDGGYSVAPGASHQFFVGPDALRHLRKYWPVFAKDYKSTTLRPAAPRDYPDGWRTRRHWSGDQVSPFERLRVLNPAPDMAALQAVTAEMATCFPGLGPVRLKSAWAGMIDTMPDVVPVIDHVAAIPGLVVATGLSGHGFGIGPAVGRVVADLVAGNPVGHDLSRFRLSRFSDGSKLVTGPSL